MQKPVITMESDGAKELLTSYKNCILVNNSDPNELAEVIKLLARRSDLSKQIARNGYKLITNKLTPKILGQNLLKIIRS